MLLCFSCLIFFFNCYLNINANETCDENSKKFMYSKKDNEILKIIDESLDGYIPCPYSNCSCYYETITKDLSDFKNGITKTMLKAAYSKGTVYKIIRGQLYRNGDCMFPTRCGGVEYFLLKLSKELPNIEFVLNTRDWPQVMRFQRETIPVFSFSKTLDYLDIMYPAWAFWAGGPAIKLYPRGLGDWEKFRLILDEAREKSPWKEKKPVIFFRGSRTHNDRDALVLLSRKDPAIADAAYTKNQAWKSTKDTLHAPPADEVALEEHCKYKYLFNFRGVAASFRFKYLLLCGSLVFNVGDEWLEFFYPTMKPWVHYIPVKSGVTQEEIRSILEFFKHHDDIAEEIAQRGRDFIWNHLTNEDVLCYWKVLLQEYAKLLKFKPKVDGIELKLS